MTVESLVNKVSDMAALRAIADEESTDEDTLQESSANRKQSAGDSPHDDSDSEEITSSLLQLIELPAGIFVFNARDISKLRLTHRIVGSMCGPLQSQPGHAQAAPPLKLRPEETRLLLECGIATLVSPSTLNCVPPQEKLKAFDQFNRRLHEVSNIERYRDKLQAVCNPPHRPRILKKRPPNPSGVPYQPKPYDEKDPFTVQLVDTPFSTTMSVSSLPYIRSISNSPEAELRYQVFRELWDQGNYIGGASNFGADFLVYRGDPSAYHAYACIKCLPVGSRVTAADLVRYCRISNTIKKNFVFASLVNHHVRFVTVTWEV